MREQNALDLELYAWGGELLRATLAAWPGFDEALAAFRRRNERYQPLGKLAQLPRNAADRVAGR